MTLLSADATLKFLLSKLVQTNRPICQKFSFALEKRIKERRTDLFGVAQYLHNPTDVCNNNNFGTEDIFSTPKKIKIRQIIKELIERLYVSQSPIIDQVDDIELVSVTEPATAKNLKEQFLDEITKRNSQSSVSSLSFTNSNLNAVLVKEMS